MVYIYLLYVKRIINNKDNLMFFPQNTISVINGLAVFQWFSNQVNSLQFLVFFNFNTNLKTLMKNLCSYKLEEELDI